MRIHIIGGPGSGKTTLARQLALNLRCAPTDLDDIAYAGGAKRPLAERLGAIRAQAAQPVWSAEGIYLWWVDDLLRAADVIVWLDIPWRVAAQRIVMRHARASLAGTNPHPGLRRLFRFLRSAHHYYVDPNIDTQVALDDDGAITRARTAHELARYAEKTVRCATPADAASVLSDLQSGRCSSRTA